MWRLIHEVQLGRACDSLRLQLETELITAKVTIQRADSVIKAEHARTALEIEGGKILRARAENRDKQNAELRDELKKQKMLTIAVAVVSVLAILIAL